MRGVPRHSRTAGGASAPATTKGLGGGDGHATLAGFRRERGAAPRRGQGQPQVVGPRGHAGARAAERLSGQGLAGRRLLPARFQDGLRGPVADPARHHLRGQGRGAPRGDAHGGGQALGHTGRRGHEAHAQAGGQRLRGAGHVVRALGHESGQGRRRIRGQPPVHVVLDRRQVVTADDFRDRRAPALPHHGGGGVLDGRHAVQDPRAARPARFVEGLGHDPLLVERHAVQAQAQQAGDRLQARVGEIFDEDDVALAGEHRQEGHETVLAPVAYDDAVGGHAVAAAVQPLRGCFAMRAAARVGRVGQKRCQVTAPRERAQRGLQSRRLRAFDRRWMVDAHLDDPRGVGVAGDPGFAAPGRTHERPAADLTRDQPAPRRFGVRAADGADRHPQPIGEVPMRRQLRARGQTRRRDVVGKRLRDREITWETTPHRRPPHCHGDNIPIDTYRCQA